jgi:hypothetical protein
MAHQGGDRMDELDDGVGRRCVGTVSRPTWTQDELAALSIRGIFATSSGTG